MNIKVVVVSKSSINMTTYNHVKQVSIDYDTNKATIYYETSGIEVVNLLLNNLFILQ